MGTYYIVYKEATGEIVKWGRSADNDVSIQAVNDGEAAMPITNPNDRLCQDYRVVDGELVENG